MDPTVPYLLTGVLFDPAKEKAGFTALAQEAVDGVKALLQTEAKKGLAGATRGQKPISQDLQNAVKLVSASIPVDLHTWQDVDTSEENSEPEQAKRKLAEGWIPSVYGLAAHEVFAGAERNHLGAIRLNTEGTRRVICTPELSMEAIPPRLNRNKMAIPGSRIFLGLRIPFWVPDVLWVPRGTA